jgi:hypothetical protein
MTIQNRQNPLPELKDIFLNKILPLLQEYFYGDWGKIMMILGPGFVQKKEEKVKFMATLDDYDDVEARPVYCFTNAKDWTLDTFTKVYE